MQFFLLAIITICLELIKIECDILKLKLEIESEIDKNPLMSIQKLWEVKQVDLVKVYGAKLVAGHLPEFKPVDSHFFVRKNKSLPTLPKSM